MAHSLNKVQLIGSLGKDPELKYTPAGIAVATFSIATSESWKDAEGNQQEKTEWHNIVAWRKLAEICGEFLKKGKKVYLEGKIQTRNYEKDGIKRYVTEIVADQLIMLDGGKQAKYFIKPDRKLSQIAGELTYRFHPITKFKTMLNGDPVLDENGQKEFFHPVGIDIEDIQEIL